MSDYEEELNDLYHGFIIGAVAWILSVSGIIVLAFALPMIDRQSGEWAWGMIILAIMAVAGGAFLTRLRRVPRLPERTQPRGFDVETRDSHEPKK